MPTAKLARLKNKALLRPKCPIHVLAAYAKRTAREILRGDKKQRRKYGNGARHGSFMAGVHDASGVCVVEGATGGEDAASSDAQLTSQNLTWAATNETFARRVSAI